MNTSDIRNLSSGQNFFWAIAGPISLVIIAVAVGFAFRLELKRLFHASSRRSLREEEDVAIEMEDGHAIKSEHESD